MIHACVNTKPRDCRQTECTPLTRLGRACNEGSYNGDGDAQMIETKPPGHPGDAAEAARAGVIGTRVRERR
jgi:hypothetical protein